jgi:hypothetical protein
MIKKTLLLLSPFLLLADNSQLLNRINTLEKEVEILKEKKYIHEEELDETAQILEEVEKKSILDKINFSPELELRFDKMDYKVGDIKGEETKIYGGPYDGEYRRKEYSKDFDLATSINFKLNMSAQLDEYVKFNGRLAFAYNSQSYQRLCILSRDIKSSASSSAFNVERAYFDYSPNKISDYAFTFTFGLLPTTGGTPMQLAKNKKRNSMFPALVFNMNTYGIIATQKFHKKTYLRAIFAKAYTMRSAFYAYQCNRENIDNANVMGLYLDHKTDFLGDTLLTGGINYLGDFKAHPYLGPDVTTDNSDVLGNIMTLGLGIDIQHFIKSNFNIFLHYAMSIPDGNGNVDDYQIVAPFEEEKTASGDVGFSEADYAKGEMLDETGYAIFLGAKYNVNSDFDFALEYNYGSKHWFSATQGAEDMYNKLATRGHVIEAYGIWNFHTHLFAKIGYMYTKEEYTGSGWHFGEPVDKDGTQQISYLTLNARF